MSNDFPLDSEGRAAFVQNLEDQLTFLEQISNLIILEQTEEPDQKDFETAWVNAGYSLPIVEEAEFLWDDTTRIRGIYGTLNDYVYRVVPRAFEENVPPALIEWDRTNEGVLAYNGSAWYSGNLDNIYKTELTALAAFSDVVWKTSETDLEDKAYFAVLDGTIKTYNRDGILQDTFVSVGTPLLWKEGKIFFISGNNLYVVNKDGTNEVQLTTEGDVQYIYHFEPDPLLTKVYYITSSRLWVVDIDGTNRTDLSVGTDITHLMGFISADAFWVRYNSGESDYTYTVSTSSFVEEMPFPVVDNVIETTNTGAINWLAMTKLSPYNSTYSPLLLSRHTTSYFPLLWGNEYLEKSSTTFVRRLSMWEDEDVPDMKLIASLNASGQANFEVTNDAWGSDYDHLLLLVQVRTTNPSTLTLSFNDVSAINTHIYGYLGNAVTGITSVAGGIRVTAINSSHGYAWVLLPDVNSPDTNKTAFVQTDYLIGGISTVTAPVEKITLQAGVEPLISGAIRVFGLKGSTR